MDELRDSSPLAGDWQSLRDQVREDGYVFLRDLADRELALAAGRGGLAALQRAGWLAPGADPERAAILSPPRPTDQARAWRDAGYRSFAISEAFHRLAYQPAVEQVMGLLMGAGAFCYPVKVARVVYPAAMVPLHGGMFVHQDLPVVGVPDMFTVWMPLMDIPYELGSLCIRPGSQIGPLAAPTVIDPHEPGWATADFRAGDLLVFHCLTVHAALPNQLPRLRLSGECRWQLAADPVPSRLVYGPDHDGTELWSRLFGRKGWWHPVPEGLRIVERSELPEPSRIRPSRYVDAAVGPPPLWPRFDVVPH